MNYRFFITGGAGFIGSSLIAYLNSLGYEDIYILEKPSWPKKWKNLVGLKYRDVLDAPFYNNSRDWAKLFEKYIQLKESVFINLGADSATAAASDLETYHTNVVLPQYLIKICGPDNVRFIQASSAAVYGAEENNFQERVDGLKPTNFYGWTKLEVDKYIDSCKDQKFFKENVFSLRFFNVYGPRENYKKGMCSVIYKWINQGIDAPNCAVELFKSDRANYKNGEQSRDFVYVEDVCKIIYHCATVRAEDELGGIYNVGSGETTLYNSVISNISSVLDWHPDIQYIDMPPLVKQHYQYRTRADLTNLRTKLNYQENMTPLRKGIEKTYRYIIEN